MPSPLPPVTLKGEHVCLEPLRLEHAEELWPAASERSLWAYMTFDVASVEDLRTWIGLRLRDRDAGTAIPLLQRDARTGQAFGSTSLFDIDLAHGRMEIGHTWLGASHRRTAANTEAKLLLFAHAFETMGANRVQLKCDARNLRSQAAIARLGAVREGVLRNHVVLPDGYVRDTVMFSVVRAEWPAVHGRLGKLLAR
ncbi:MAG TPA: GNAT family protein [Candidatus Thermoplasmatota archaeon]|nr:GNAT family protein [Candidatus Thermoplasmatota archaeon]